MSSQVKAVEANSRFPSARSCILAYITGLGFALPSQAYPTPSATRILNQLIQEIESWNIPNLNRRDPSVMSKVDLAVSVGELSYQGHEYQIRYFMSLISFFHVYIDDRTSRCSGATQMAPFTEFQRRYIHSLPQLDPVLDHLVSTIETIGDMYDDLSANSIIATLFEFINGCYLENISLGMNVHSRADRYPYFLRSKSGGSQAYALYLFPKSYFKDPLAYIQAIPSITYWTDITNDILSFYKEDLAGETTNHVHLRAKVTGREPLQVLQELVEEALSTVSSIEEMLDGECLDAWLTYKFGYTWFHFTQKRYRLSELSLDLVVGSSTLESNDIPSKDLVRDIELSG